jgi:flavin-binding protein dodecin
MSERVYKKIRLVGISRDSFEDAIQNAVKEAGKTLRGLAWFEVVEQRGAIVDKGAVEFQVTIEIGFRLD